MLCMSSTLLPYEQAVRVVAEYTVSLGQRPPGAEWVALADASGRILARDLTADRDQPPFARSTRDGFACRAAEASRHIPLRVAGMIHAGQAPAGPLPDESAWEIMTGAPIPQGADAVAMVEHVTVEDGGMRLTAARTLKAGENMVAQGAQAHTGDLLLKAGSRLGPGQIALAAACGFARLEVYRRPRVAILATGDELVAVDCEPAPGQIRNSNAPMLAALVADAGGEPWVLPAAADTREALDQSLAEALKADLLIVSGGVSAGKFDLVEPALADLGAAFFFTGVRMQPGKPVVFGELPRAGRPALPFFGLPGNPVSTAVTFLLFASRVLVARSGGQPWRPKFATARLAKSAQKQHKPGLTRFLPAHCNLDASEQAAALPLVEVIPMEGSGDLTALARANCFLMIPAEDARLSAGAKVRLLLI
jgi:molybdopterin molybdotransferase